MGTTNKIKQKKIVLQNFFALAKQFNIFNQKVSLTLEYDQYSYFYKKVYILRKKLQDKHF